MLSGTCAGGRCLALSAVAFAALTSICCGTPSVRAKDTRDGESGAIQPRVREVGVVPLARKTLQTHLTVSSELVPFQQIDVYAKESGFVRRLNVDYGTHVRAGQVMAVLEIPELQMQLDEDEADIHDATAQVGRIRQELDQVQAQHNVLHLEYVRLNTVAKSQAGLVAQQEVDNAQSSDLASEAQVGAAAAALQSAESQLSHALAKRRRDQALFDYSKITAPFTGVVTRRDANLGTLMQAAINSSTQALPLVQLSEDDLFRLVIPVPESYVRFIRLGDPVAVSVPALNRTFPGHVARFAAEIQTDTRTMHTEVDVPNPTRVLMPGLYAEATLTLSTRQGVLTVPPEAVTIEGDQRSVWLVGPSDKLQLRNVKLGIETPNDMEVLSGLSEGERVAVGDRSSLHAGETVRPKPVQLIGFQGAQQ